MTILKASYAPTAHEDYLYSYNFSGVYDYDSADDGPECEAIKAILATHTEAQLYDEFLSACWYGIDLAGSIQ